MNAGQLVQQVGIDLNDPQHTVWSQEQISYYLAEALRIAFSFRKDLFSSVKTVKLEAGSQFQRVCDCTDITELFGVTDSEGHILYTVRKRTLNPALDWKGAKCDRPAGRYHMYEYSLDPDNNGFRVYPAPPYGQDVYVSIACAEMPDISNAGTQLSNELTPAVVQWALYRCLDIDADTSATAHTVAVTHQQMFFKLLKIPMIGEYVSRHFNKEAKYNVAYAQAAADSRAQQVAGGLLGTV